MEGVIDGQARVPAFLVWRETLLLDGTGLAILLAGHVLVAGVAAVIGSPLEDLALRTDHVVAPIIKASPGHDAGFLPGVNGNVGGNALLVQQLSQSARIVSGVGSQGRGLDGQLLQKLGYGLPFTFGGMSDPTGEDESAPVHDGVVR